MPTENDENARVCSDQAAVVSTLIEARGNVTEVTKREGLVYMTLGDGAHVGVLPETIFAMGQTAGGIASEVFNGEPPTWFRNLLAPNVTVSEPVPLPQVNVTYRAVHGMETSESRTRIGNSFSERNTIRSTSDEGTARYRAENVSTAGANMAAALSTVGITVPGELYNNLGVAYLALTHSVDHNLAVANAEQLRSNRRMMEVENEARTETHRMAQQRDRARRDLTALKDVEAAALKWRDVTGSDVERFEAFNALMAAVSSLSTPEAEPAERAVNAEF